MTNTYAFVLGRVHTLSLAELFTLFKKHNFEVKVVDASPEVLVVESESTLDPEKWQKMLGGTIKILKVVDTLRKRPQDSINFALQHYFRPSRIKKDFLKNYTGKIQFGVSGFRAADSQLRPPSVPDGEGSAHRRRNFTDARCP
jgi:tRNA G10  N-methylase Trm11